ncbi:MAG TPA: VWA domain-containing protein [Blastocatellia bacterium]|nr:VWA domain-containing protein [Blastocatellia bacterium]
MRERMRVTMSVKGVENLRQVLLIVLFGALSCYLTIRAVSAIGQSERAQPAPQTQRPGETQTKPTPTPSAQQPKKAERPPAEEQNETIKINSNLVAVPVSVTDASGEPVRNLGAEDFQIEEEGKSQQVVALGEPGKTPVELALLFDVSGSVYERFQFQQQAASRFLREVLKPNDAASIFTIGLRPKLVHTRAVGGDAAVAAAMAVSPTKEATAFFDTVVEAAQYVGKTAETGSRRVVVVISDGEDTISDKYKLPDASKELQRADCLFYSINPSGPSIRLNVISIKAQNGMISLASSTGGAAFLPDGDAALDKVFRQIAAELQAQYLLGYYAPDERADGAFRRITVRVPKRPDLRVRARQGYYAPKA